MATMKTRESGMPEEPLWSTFFDPPEVLRKLGLTRQCHDAVDVGCGYGTFTIAAARIVSETVHALDIEPDMIAAAKAKAEAAGLDNVRACLRDFVADGFGLPAASADFVMLFNILHAEQPTTLLAEAFRVLSPGGLAAVVHWNYDPTTPRGPSMDIRPRPEDIRQWARQVGFSTRSAAVIDLPPYHYGMVFER